MICHILIVEDDAALNLALTLHFEEQGFQVTSAHRIQEALAALAMRPPDAALLDQQLPDGAGLELLGKAVPHVPPLRERRDDIPLLASGLMARLCQYDWPGNVRELVNVLTQALVRARYPVLTPDLLSLPDCASASASDGPLLTGLSLATR